MLVTESANTACYKLPQCGWRSLKLVLKTVSCFCIALILVAFSCSLGKKNCIKNFYHLNIEV